MQRAYAQQSTFIPENVLPTPADPVLTKIQPNEVCIGCVMRDQDMIDVDVISPGVWDRESDIYYEELRRGGAEEATGMVDIETSPRLRAQSRKLTEQNLKLWSSMNPVLEPTSREQRLNTFLEFQQTFLEAEAARLQDMTIASTMDTRS
ncbi:hypothetical protein V5O48_012891 [Marasmius crinis-equi]|uniref:Uncharacterized protein n=1 Tax=Marasmius crinis-equi TaxID=585013 RepID=A0ABR3F1L4_9AGAR